MSSNLFLGLLYWLGLSLAALLTAAIKPGWIYALSCATFVGSLFIGLSWAMEGLDGPVGFTVVAVHGLIFWIFIFAHLAKWGYIGFRTLRRRLMAVSKSTLPHDA